MDSFVSIVGEQKGKSKRNRRGSPLLGAPAASPLDSRTAVVVVGRTLLSSISQFDEANLGTSALWCERDALRNLRKTGRAGGGGRKRTACVDGMAGSARGAGR